MASGSAERVRLSGFGVSEFLKRTVSRYKKADKESLDGYVGATEGFTEYDTNVIDAVGTGYNIVDECYPEVPFSSYGETVLDLNNAAARLMENFISGIAVAPFRNFTGVRGDNYEYADFFLEHRDDRDQAYGTFVTRSLWSTSPFLVKLDLRRTDTDYANSWKFDGASFVGTIRSNITHRARKGATLSKPGFSVLPMLAFSGNMDELFSQGWVTEMPGTVTEQYPFSFVGWTAKIVRYVNRLGYYSREGSTDSNDWQYGGGELALPTYVPESHRLDIRYWADTEPTKVNFQTFQSFPGSTSEHDVVDWREYGIILEISPNERNVERFVRNTKMSP